MQLGLNALGINVLINAQKSIISSIWAIFKVFLYIRNSNIIFKINQILIYVILLFFILGALYTRIFQGFPGLDVYCTGNSYSSYVTVKSCRFGFFGVSFSYFAFFRGGSVPQPLERQLLVSIWLFFQVVSDIWQIWLNHGFVALEMEVYLVNVVNLLF